MILGIDQPERSAEIVPAPEIAASDEAAHLDGRMMHELTKVNYQLSQYVLRFLDADAGRVSPTPVADELALASCLETAANAIRARAKRHSHGSDSGNPVEGSPR